MDGLHRVQGDGLGETTLYEVKCGQSRVRGKDLKQVLCYLALNYASRMYSIEEVAVLNPRRGIVLRSTVESLCRNIAGTSAAELLGDIVAYVSGAEVGVGGRLNPVAGRGYRRLQSEVALQNCTSNPRTDRW